MSIEKTLLYKEMTRRAAEITAGPSGLMHEFERLREIVREHSKCIILLFPEYTPHDYSRHLDQLFSLADRILGMPLYEQLSAVELILLAFGLYAHDWGMAVSESEKKNLLLSKAKRSTGSHFDDESQRAQAFISEANLSGISPEIAWCNYVRRTHGLRSGSRLRSHLEPFGTVFAEVVAKIAEGHTLPLREVRDPNRYPSSISVFGETVNIAAITTYVRVLDLLDIGEDRTPYALWTFISPVDSISSIEWQKHRSLSPVSVKQDSALREILITGQTDDFAVFAALADFRTWVDEQFAGAIAQLREIGGKYDLDIDSSIIWNIEAVGFNPLIIRFELNRHEVLSLLSDELYHGDPHAFVRELLQNSVDAIDAREALLNKHGLSFKGKIYVHLVSDKSNLFVRWKDNGIGMNEDILSQFFAQTGKCWYRSREAGTVAPIEAISRFGVGILSVFAVSHTLTVETRRDPQTGDSSPGLIVDIPSLDSHFRVRTVNNTQVGTTLCLRIPLSSVSVISEKSIRLALRQVARFVRHQVIIESDEGLIETGLQATSDCTGVPFSSSDYPGMKIAEMRADSAQSLQDTTMKVSFEIGSVDSRYHGYYSALVPREPAKVKSNTDHSVWNLGDKVVDLDDILVSNESALFVKGIQAGPVSKKGRYNRQDFSLIRYSSWIKPALLLNVSHPSCIDFNLARSSARVKSSNLLEDVWNEIALKLRSSVYDWPVANAADSALLLGACALFGAVPDNGLEALVGSKEYPLLVLRAGKGLTWTVPEKFSHDDQILEAPFELGYSTFKDSSNEIGCSSVLGGWEGSDALFPLDGLSSHRYPWLNYVVSFSYKLLKRDGWYPATIAQVTPSMEENIPLVCRVWRNSSSVHVIEGIGEDETLETYPKDLPWNVLTNLYREAPQVFPFPQSIAKHAAFGSRYWNSNHPKIKAIIPVLTQLMERLRSQSFSPDSKHEIAFITSNKFYGYVVPARFARTDLALETPNRLLDIAEKEGLASVERLTQEDFVAGTIGRYRNPYHYNLDKWKNLNTGLGQRCD